MRAASGKQLRRSGSVPHASHNLCTCCHFCGAPGSEWEACHFAGCDSRLPSLSELPPETLDALRTLKAHTWLGPLAGLA